MTIIETTANQFYFVADYADPNLAHAWRGLRVKDTGKGIWKVVGKREEMVRKVGCHAITNEGGTRVDITELFPFFTAVDQ